MSLFDKLITRAHSKCELCASETELSLYEVAPVKVKDENSALIICSTCKEQIENPASIEANHWRSLSESMWSEYAPVQVMAWRMLTQLKTESWAQDLLEQLYLDDSLVEWAKAGLPEEEEVDSSAPTLDSNGTKLAEGDSVTLIKDLDVKGGGFTAKRGTLVKNISLTNNPKHIEGKVNGIQIVLVAAFLKKSMMHLFWPILLILSQLTWAQEAVIDKDVLETCRAEIQFHCQAELDAKKPRDVLKCLAKNENQLPLVCRQQMQRWLQASAQASSRGGGSLAQFGGMTGLTPPIPFLSYEGRITPDSGSGDHPKLIRDNRLLISSPVYKNEKHSVIASLSAGHLYMGQQIKLDDGSKVPKNLYRTEVGAIFNKKVGDRRNFSLRGTFGYTGDEIQTNTQSFSLTTTYTYPRSSGQWLVMAFLSNNAGTFIPIPGFGYIIRTPTFNATLGLPMISMQWTPVAPWSYSFTALGPQISLEAAYGSLDHIQYFSNINWTQQRYILSERDEFRDRLTFEEKKWAVGVRTPVTVTSLLEVQSGLTFDRKVYNGQGMFDHSGGDARLKSDWFLSLALKVAL